MPSSPHAYTKRLGVRCIGYSDGSEQREHRSRPEEGFDARSAAEEQHPARQCWWHRHCRCQRKRQRQQEQWQQHQCRTCFQPRGCSLSRATVELSISRTAWSESAKSNLSHWTKLY